MALKKELIYIDDIDKTDTIETLSKDKNNFIITFKNSPKVYNYNSQRIRIKKSGIHNTNAKNIFDYLCNIVKVTGYNLVNQSNILEQIYSNISFIPEESILASYLNIKQPLQRKKQTHKDIFPFGFNLSQKEALNKAFDHPLSIIEGPPGTGKTQTILNIIANAVMNNQSIAIVSNNNAAAKNVYEKLYKNDVACIAAVLGNNDNKREFIDTQRNVTDLSPFYLSEESYIQKTTKATELYQEIVNKLALKNECALIAKEIDDINTEYKHFQLSPEPLVARALPINSDRILSLWLLVDSLIENNKKLTWWNTWWYQIKYRIIHSSFFDIEYKDIITICQSAYYVKKMAELTTRRNNLEQLLVKFCFETKMKEYTEIAMLLFKNALYKKYKKQSKREYTLADLQRKPQQFLEDFPVIISTTHSLRTCLSNKIMYDYVIIDEASQVDIATGALALSCAKNAVIVGDLKQLPHVVTTAIAKETNRIFESFNIPESFSYTNHSILSSINTNFPLLAKTLLKEHYRCHPKIIDFCNKKFYNNELIIHTKYDTSIDPLKIYKTNAGNHARERVNQRQIDVIKNEIIPHNNLEGIDLGIVTPYRNQTHALQTAFSKTGILADTVDKFQGRENDTIILCSVDNEISEFTDNANRLNVAISRAIKQLIVLIHGNDYKNDTNYADFIQYIEYNNYTTIESDIRSVFDYLYKGYEKQRQDIIRKNGKQSAYDSENLMYAVIKEILSLVKYAKYDVILHYPLKNIIKNYSKLTSRELEYALHPATHVDFLIYNKLGKKPVMAIEVDGYRFHKKHSRQAERDVTKNSILNKYNIPLLRLSTTGSQEYEKLEKALSNI